MYVGVVYHLSIGMRNMNSSKDTVCIHLTIVCSGYIGLAGSGSCTLVVCLLNYLISFSINN